MHQQVVGRRTAAGWGTVIETLDYSPYGGQCVDTKAGTYVGEKDKYAQRPFDGVSGLNYAQARYQSTDARAVHLGRSGVCRNLRAAAPGFVTS